MAGMAQAKPGVALGHEAGLAAWVVFEGDDPAPCLGRQPARVTPGSIVLPW
jgi:hypothetical protein